MLLVRYKYSYDGERGEIICHIEVSSYQHTTKHNTKEFKVDLSNKKLSKAFLSIQRGLVYGTRTSLDTDSRGYSDHRHSGIAQACVCDNSNRPCSTGTT